MADIAADLAAGYEVPGASVILGRPLRPDLQEPITDVFVQVPLQSLNKHGLVAGATGTGKTKTLQLIAEQLSDQGVPVFLADVKGDLTGLADPGDDSEPVRQRMAALDLPWTPAAFPVECLSLTGRSGTPLRTTVTSFGPLLLAKVLDLNETQSGVLAVAFRYADEHGLTLLDLEDLTALLRFLTSDEGQDAVEAYGGMSGQTLGVILRKVMELEGQGAEAFFGEPEFDIRDLLRVEDGRGVVTLLELSDVQQQPKLWSTFLMWLLGELFEELPEIGDPEQPELVFFFDEAHLLFDDASKALTDAIEQTVRLIRSKGVGVFFVTQQPKDVPQDVLAQLGNRVQHALRALTPQDAKAIDATADTFPVSDHYDVGETLTALGTGEALVTVLNPKGQPTPTAAVRLTAPRSAMRPAADPGALFTGGRLRDTYAQEVDRESAAEQLAARAEQRAAAAAEKPDERRVDGVDHETARPRSGGRQRQSAAESFAKSAASAVGREIGRQLVRSFLGNLRR